MISAPRPATQRGGEAAAACFLDALLHRRFPRRSVTLQTEGFLSTQTARTLPSPPPPPVCVSYVTLGGFLSVCLTVTLPECCWEVVAIGPCPPLLLLSIRYSSLLISLCSVAPLFPTCPPSLIKTTCLGSAVQSGSVFGVTGVEREGARGGASRRGLGPEPDRQ